MNSTQIFDLGEAILMASNTLKTPLNSPEKSPQLKRRKIHLDDLNQKSDYELSVELNSLKRKIRECNYSNNLADKEIYLQKESLLKKEENKRTQEFIQSLNSKF